MTMMEQVVDAVRVDAHGAAGWKNILLNCVEC